MLNCRPANGFECPTPPSPKTTNVEHELIFQQDAGRSKCQGVPKAAAGDSLLGGYPI
ncbi:MAG: hypothetical protein IH991_00945 [Planctomycetes bacterium]|nr:hypothetical protein [Planctomycetota bacterium]